MVGKGDRVGGRPVSLPPAPRGGGYPDICSESGLPARAPLKNLAKNFDLTLQDLAAMGLSEKWMDIAARVGVEAFVDIWIILDRENLSAPRGADPIRLKVPRFSRLERFARNRLIMNLLSDGQTSREVFNEVHRRNLAPVCWEAFKKIVDKVKKHDD